ncbi:hypothetical protein [Streptantibioticus ferralitis]|uniref:Uncharacterized protein n=1 Tax=Streptantibioticus ferralitis TaxID=236510 RepID=A0ABT5Z7G0_9ACTN|nr:hypothetical protein [Streptantibioticus ferralitis]MDF2259769.1 hypothetical protein [Streptantibioticus ferralitis]
MPDPRTFQIPTDLDRRHPKEITEWMSSVEDDETISDADVFRAREAVTHALGID